MLGDVVEELGRNAFGRRGRRGGTWRAKVELELGLGQDEGGGLFGGGRRGDGVHVKSWMTREERKGKEETENLR
jgi:hypothetical protein